jgi:hypothetical protein
VKSLPFCDRLGRSGAVSHGDNSVVATPQVAPTHRRSFETYGARRAPTPDAMASKMTAFRSIVKRQPAPPEGVRDFVTSLGRRQSAMSQVWKLSAIL